MPVYSRLSTLFSRRIMSQNVLPAERHAANEDR